MELCQSDNNLYPDCDDNFFWADGTFASEIYSNPLININDMDGNGPNGCMRLRWNVYIGDKSCINTLPYVCQYRCEQGKYTHVRTLILHPSNDIIVFRKCAHTFKMRRQQPRPSGVQSLERQTLQRCERFDEL